MTVYIKNERKGKEEKHDGKWRDRGKGRRKKEGKGKGRERERERRASGLDEHTYFWMKAVVELYCACGKVP